MSQNNCRVLQYICMMLPGGKEEFIEGMNLHHRLELISACGYPRYTNFVSGFAGCLDYIYVGSNLLKVVNVVPLPSHDDVTMYTALPNVVFPSDHLSLVCELEWSKSGPMPDSS